MALPTTTPFRDAMRALHWSDLSTAQELRIDERTIRRWKMGHVEAPDWAVWTLRQVRLVVDGVLEARRG